MKRITNEMIQKTFEIGKKIHLKKLSRLDGIKVLEGMGMKKSSAQDYIYTYSHLIQGRLFTRTINSYGTEYYLEKIYLENGAIGLKQALLSLSLHIDYYENISRSSVKKGKKIYDKFYELVKTNLDQIVYADEVDGNQEYSEGKSKNVFVNKYERNPIARQKCIEHYGLNCQLCEFNFEEKFGELGKDFIHVHHKIDISTIGKEYSVDPINDLIPVCPNCHSMLHKKKPAYTLSELKILIK